MIRIQIFVSHFEYVIEQWERKPLTVASTFRLAVYNHLFVLLQEYVDILYIQNKYKFAYLNVYFDNLNSCLRKY